MRNIDFLRQAIRDETDTLTEGQRYRDWLQEWENQLKEAESHLTTSVPMIDQYAADRAASRGKPETVPGGSITESIPQAFASGRAEKVMTELEIAHASVEAKPVFGPVNITAATKELEMVISTILSDPEKVGIKENGGAPIAVIDGKEHDLTSLIAHADLSHISLSAEQIQQYHALLQPSDPNRPSAFHFSYRPSFAAGQDPQVVFRGRMQENIARSIAFDTKNAIKEVLLETRTDLDEEELDDVAEAFANGNDELVGFCQQIGTKFVELAASSEGHDTEAIEQAVRDTVATFTELTEAEKEAVVQKLMTPVSSAIIPRLNAARMPGGEMEALNIYSGPSYSSINAVFRGNYAGTYNAAKAFLEPPETSHEDGFARTVKEALAHAAVTVSALNKLPDFVPPGAKGASAPQYLFRGEMALPQNVLEARKEASLHQGVIREVGFVSTSHGSPDPMFFGPSSNAGVLIANCKGKNIADFSQNEEREILLPPTQLQWVESQDFVTPQGKTITLFMAQPITSPVETPIRYEEK